jgi:hypothetical protein
MRRLLAFTAPGWAIGIALLMAALCLCVPQASAQTWHSGKVKPNMTVYSTVEGSFSNSGSLLEMSNDVGFNFTPLLGVDAIFPVYFVVPPAPQSVFSTSMAGIGNLAADGRLSLPLLFVHYQATGTVAFPTGSTSKGFSTGVITADLDNRFERSYGLITPFLDIDVGNSLNNGNTPGRLKIQRPYLTYGNVAEFTAGPQIQILDRISLSADVYQALPWGPQTVYSRILPAGATGSGGQHNRVFEIAQVTNGGSKLVADNGYAGSVEFSPTRYLDLTAGMTTAFTSP